MLNRAAKALKCCSVSLRGLECRIRREQALQTFDEGKGFRELREARFVGLEFGRVDAAAQAARLDGVLEVEHLVVEQVLDGVARAGGPVEDAADDDGIVGGVVMAERALGVMLAPGEVRAAK